MDATCAQALAAGLRTVAFTEHADFVERDRHPGAVVDLRGYLEDVAACRERYPALVIETGVELGQPHMYAEETAELLASAPGGLDRILGSVHVARVDGELADVSGLTHSLGPHAWVDVVRSSLSVTLDLVTSGVEFEVLAHLDYAKRFWPHKALAYDETLFEAEYRAVLSAAADRDLVLEINSTRGAPAHRALGPGLRVLRWWHELGGAAVSFGSDSHDPTRVGRGLQAAAELAAQAGFHPRDAAASFWGRRVSS